MAKQIIGVGAAPNDSTGDTLRGAFTKVNANFTEVYTATDALGTAADLDVPAIGDAAVGEVVKGDDSRLTDARTPAAHNHDANYEPLDATILKDADIGINVQAYNANALDSSDIGVSIEAKDITILRDADIGVSVEARDATILKAADIGVSVEARDATILKAADIGVSVQAYDANTAKYDDVIANFTGSLRIAGSVVLDSGDIGISVQGYDATLLNAADIGVSVQGYDATLLNAADIGSAVQAYDADLTSWGAKTVPSGDPVGTTDTQNLSNKILIDPTIQGTVKEDAYTITDGASVALDPANGGIQLWTLGANRTPAAAPLFLAGHSILLGIQDGTAYTMTWTTLGVVWVGGTAPTLETTGYTWIELWKTGSVLRGALVGGTAT